MFVFIKENARLAWSVLCIHSLIVATQDWMLFRNSFEMFKCEWEIHLFIFKLVKECNMLLKQALKNYSHCIFIHTLLSSKLSLRCGKRSRVWVKFNHRTEDKVASYCKHHAMFSKKPKKDILMDLMNPKIYGQNRNKKNTNHVWICEYSHCWCNFGQFDMVSSMPMKSPKYVFVLRIKCHH